MKYIKTRSIQEEAQEMMIPSLLRDIEQLKANQEYISMMSDVELPDNEEEDDDNVFEVQEG